MSRSGFPHTRRVLRALARIAIVLGTRLRRCRSADDIRQSQTGRCTAPHARPTASSLVQARNSNNGGLNLDMWGAVVDRNGIVVGHPTCTAGTTAVSVALPTDFPIGH